MLTGIIRSLTAVEPTTLAEVGGKGLSLIRMTQAGLPVPPGFVITAQAYDAFVAFNQFQAQIVDLTTQTRLDDPNSFEISSEGIRSLFATSVIPDEAATEVKNAYDRLAHKHGRAVAVRSSATAEDLPAASFAGQHDTYLNICGEASLLEAVRKCWVSLWTARAMAYRARMGIDRDAVSMAVIVQTMVEAEVSGILFTANPATGARDEAVINAGFGLGEAIVSGRAAPDTVVVDKSNWQIASRKTAAKTVMTVRTDDGTTEQPVPQAQQDQPVLNDDDAIELVRYGTQIEALYGTPMDIEWAISDDEIAVLQARPITNLPPAPLRDVRWDPPVPDTIWMRRQVVEHMPEPLSPLFDDLYLHEGLNRALDTIFDFFHDLSGVEFDLWSMTPGGSFAGTVNGYAYSLVSYDYQWSLIPKVLRFYARALGSLFRHIIPYWRDEQLPAYLEVVERWSRLDLAGAADEELLAGVRKLAAADAVYWFAANIPLALARFTDTALDRFLKSIFARRISVDGAPPASGLYLRGFPTKAMEAQAQLEAIAHRIRDSAALRELTLNTPARQLLDALAQQPGGQDALDDLQLYLDRYGHQIYNLDFAEPTQADDPLPVLLSLQAAVEHPERDALAHQERLAQERDALARRTAQSLNPLSRRLFLFLLRWAQRFTPYREEALFYVGAAWPTLRRLALELGRRLTEAGSLDVPDDVFFLNSAELADAIDARAGGLARPELARLAREQRELREARKRLEPPVAVPPGARFKIGPIKLALFEPKPERASEGPTLDGFAVSPGQVTAPASVIRSAADFDQMTPDTILVCTTTTPAWTPLFAQAKGLVTDIGGALAHGSIVAREYGIPAVMGTGVATRRIKSGQRIQVDGNAGTVTLLDEVSEAETAAEAPAQAAGSRTNKVVFAALGVGAAIGLIMWRRRRRLRRRAG